MRNDIPGFGCVSKLGYPPSLNRNAICFSKNLPVGFPFFCLRHTRFQLFPNMFQVTLVPFIIVFIILRDDNTERVPQDVSVAACVSLVFFGSRWPEPPWRRSFRSVVNCCLDA